MSFSSLADFAVHLAEFTMELETLKHEALEKAALIVEKEAKARIGHYQDAEGSVPGWAVLAYSTINEKEKLGYAPPDNPLLRDGDLRDSIGHVVEGNEAVVGSDSDVAVYHELGTTHIPPRSFLAGAAVNKRDEIVNTMGYTVVMALVGEDVHNGRLPL